MKTIGVVLLLLGTLLVSGCTGSRNMVQTFSGEPGEIVEAEGIAPIVDNDVLNARKAALADAQKNAVELVVGVYISAETMVQKAVTIKSNILARTEGYITQYDIIKEGKDNNFYKVKIKALVKIEEINKDLDRLDLLVATDQADNPRVSVIIEEEIDGVPSATGDAEMGLFQSLLDANFPTVESSTLSDGEIDNAPEGNASFYRVIGEKLNVEILIVGNVSAELAAKEGLGGFISYRAAANLKAIRCTDAQVLVTTSDIQTGVDIAQNIAAAKAMKQAAQKAGQNIANELATRIQQKLVVVIDVEGVSSITDLEEFQGFLEKLSEVKRVQLRNYATGNAQIDAYMEKGTLQDIAEHLTKAPRWKADIQRVSTYDMKVLLNRK